jgi:hypothetical protein
MRSQRDAWQSIAKRLALSAHKPAEERNFGPRPAISINAGAASL